MKKYCFYFILIILINASLLSNDLDIDIVKDHGFDDAIFLVPGSFTDVGSKEYLLALGREEYNEVQKLIIIKYEDDEILTIMELENSWGNILDENDALYRVMLNTNNSLGDLHSFLYVNDFNNNGYDEIFLLQISGIAFYCTVVECTNGEMEKLLQQELYPAYENSFKTDSDRNIVIVDQAEQTEKDDVYRLNAKYYRWDEKKHIYFEFKEEQFLARRVPERRLLTDIEEDK